LDLDEELDDPKGRPDLALGRDDLVVEDATLTATVHNIGGSTCPASLIEVTSADGQILGTGRTPELQPPHDLRPVTASVRIELKKGAKPARVSLDPTNKIPEITEVNNRISVPTN
jgi:hypothetical protein